jgi:hypothetical protein
VPSSRTCSRCKAMRRLPCGPVCTCGQAAAVARVVGMLWGWRVGCLLWLACSGIFGCATSSSSPADAAVANGRDGAKQADGLEASAPSADGSGADSDLDGTPDSSLCTGVTYPPARAACSQGKRLCPDVEPTLGAPCPPLARGLMCDYGAAANWYCRDYFICDECSRRWSRPVPFGCANPSSCTLVPLAGAPCDGGACTFPSNDGGYYCLMPAPDSGCPAQMPNEGECCQSPATCNYFIYPGGGTSGSQAQTMVCGDGGAWSHVIGVAGPGP